MTVNRAHICLFIFRELPAARTAVVTVDMPRYSEAADMQDDYSARRELSHGITRCRSQLFLYH